MSVRPPATALQLVKAANAVSLARRPPPGPRQPYAAAPASIQLATPTTVAPVAASAQPETVVSAASASPPAAVGRLAAAASVTICKPAMKTVGRAVMPAQMANSAAAGSALLAAPRDRRAALAPV